VLTADYLDNLDLVGVPTNSSKADSASSVPVGTFGPVAPTREGMTPITPWGALRAVGPARTPAFACECQRNAATPAGGGGRNGDLERVGQAPIRKILPPQIGHVPWVAGLPFFIVVLTGLRISTFFLSLTQ
jgi:hypothetical protein